jgi:hypothetical protein
LRRNWYLTLSILFIAVFAIFLPFWFMNFEGLKAHGGGHTTTAPIKVGDAIKAIDTSLTSTGSKMPMAVPTVDESMPHGH